jgi:hypothetical protein
MIFDNILKEKGDNVLSDLVERCNVAQAIDVEWAKNLSVETLRMINAKKSMPECMEKLLKRWYDSLLIGTPDYSVYGEPEYIAELWVCWKIYSRSHLLNIQKPASLITESIANRHRNDGVIVDLGCGFALTTTALCQIFPNAKSLVPILMEHFRWRSPTQWRQIMDLK